MVCVVDTYLSLSLSRRYLGESSVGNEVVETAQSSIIRKNCHVSSIALDIDMGSRYEMKHHPCHEILVHVTLRIWGRLWPMGLSHSSPPVSRIE